MAFIFITHTNFALLTAREQSSFAVVLLYTAYLCVFESHEHNVALHSQLYTGEPMHLCGILLNKASLWREKTITGFHLAFRVDDCLKVTVSTIRNVCSDLKHFVFSIKYVLKTNDFL
jgi:hypothetical protein